MRWQVGPLALVSRILAPVSTLSSVVAEDEALAHAGSHAMMWAGPPVT